MTMEIGFTVGIRLKLGNGKKWELSDCMGMERGGNVKLHPGYL